MSDESKKTKFDKLGIIFEKKSGDVSFGAIEVISMAADDENIEVLQAYALYHGVDGCDPTGVCS